MNAPLNSIIATAMVQRGMKPAKCYCPVCEDHNVDRDEMVAVGDDLGTSSLLIKAMTDRFGGPICRACGDGADICDETGALLLDGETPEQPGDGSDDRYDEWKEGVSF